MNFSVLLFVFFILMTIALKLNDVHELNLMINQQNDPKKVFCLKAHSDFVELDAFLD